MVTSPAPLNPRDIQLRLTASRPLLELSEPWEIILTIDNKSQEAVWVVGMTTSLLLPAEVLHPAEGQIVSRGAQLPTVAGPGFDKVCVHPGGTYNCTWRVNHDKLKMDKEAGLRSLVFWNVFFHPGKYVFRATGHFWTKEPDLGRIVLPRIIGAASSLEEAQGILSHVVPEASPPASDLQLLSLAAKNAQAGVLREGVPLSVEGVIEVAGRSPMVFGASAIGGFLAFFFRELTVASEGFNKLRANDLLLLPAYILTAVVLSLLIARVTEARLPFTIRVLDFWGAVTFGIVAALGGNALIKAAFSFLTATAP